MVERHGILRLSRLGQDCRGTPVQTGEFGWGDRFPAVYPEKFAEQRMELERGFGLHPFHEDMKI